MTFIVMVDSTPCREYDSKEDAEEYAAEWRLFYGNRVSVAEAVVEP